MVNLGVGRVPAAGQGSHPMRNFRRQSGPWPFAKPAILTNPDGAPPVQPFDAGRVAPDPHRVGIPDEHGMMLTHRGSGPELPAVAVLREAFLRVAPALSEGRAG
ncbi:hypothetical protein GCM10007935_02320 [Hydrogenophaga electricum]|uniref:Uncharacterized protein n=1 Tax=Hydrogenophaga electricum TaxID=1230953 RepID=A0ABQ6BXC4_9BURK|nr:hypothetical protein GCM10007935_02320 [Hydrogenophaga electricum]